MSPEYPPTQQTCKRCGRIDLFNFHVPDEEWEQIAYPYQKNVLCLGCFDALARAGLYEYHIDSLFFTSDWCKTTPAWEAQEAVS